MFDFNGPRRLYNCVSCAPLSDNACNCGSNTTCVVSNGDCHTCPSVSCEPNSSFTGATSSSPSKRLSPGLIAALAIPLLVVALAVVVGVWLYRRRVRFLREQLRVGVPEYPPAAVIDAERPPMSGTWRPLRSHSSLSIDATKEVAESDAAHGEQRPVHHAAADASTEKRDW
ncbi:hypothetical protein ACG7TL_004165 [Trametes sanguinea]